MEFLRSYYNNNIPEKYKQSFPQYEEIYWNEYTKSEVLGSIKYIMTQIEREEKEIEKKRKFDNEEYEKERKRTKIFERNFIDDVNYDEKEYEDSEEEYKSEEEKNQKIENGYIYMIREYEFIQKEENVYKIGKTLQRGYHTVLNRLKNGYDKKSELIFTCQVNTHYLSEIENTIRKKFQKSFIKNKKGREYFEGNKMEMVKEIQKIIIKFEEM